jgi:hypothetical protein
MTVGLEQKPSLWSQKYVIDNLPPWIYSDSQEPKNLVECKAKISALEYTIKDIELQIQIRELELKTGSSRHQSSFDYEKWKTQAMRAKQTHMYMLNAYTYWKILNEKEEGTNQNTELKKIVKLLIEEPSDFVQQMEEVLQNM